MQDEKEKLEFERDRCEKRMGRAEKLLVLLADEGVRWAETVKVIQADIEKLVGNVFISSACISYYGAFTGEYRVRMITQWLNDCIERRIPISEDFAISKIMGDPVTIRDWNMFGLPTDSVSIDNAILAT